MAVYPEYLSGWKTVRRIGSGSFSTVYEIQRSILGDIERAALKVISIPQSPDEIEEMILDGYNRESITNTFRSRLRSLVTEYSLTRKLNGFTNVVSCDDLQYAAHEDGIGWDILIRMELVTPLMKALPLEIPEETVVKLGRDICRALVRCSEYNIIHRDIKPQNIFVSDAGDFKLGDFGIAKTAEKTTSGTVAGTFKYMAPEVYFNRPYGASVDIYSLGIVMYWMLNRRRTPFLPQPPAMLTAEIDEAAKNRRFSGEALPAPATGSRQLQKIVLKACAYDPKNRYGSAEEMLRDLEALKAPKKASAPAPRPEKKPEPMPEKKAEPKPSVTDKDKTVSIFEAPAAPKSEAQPAPKPGKKAPPEPQKPEVPAPPVPDADKTVSVRSEPEGTIRAAAPASQDAPKIEKPVKKSAPPKRRSKKVWLLIPALLVCLAVAVGAVFAFRSKEDTTLVETSPLYTVLSAGSWHSVGLKSDGTVVAVGYSDDGQCDVDGWNNIVAISAGNWHSVGLKSDGTMVAVGDNDDGQCNVDRWTDIVAVSAGHYHTVGLKSDGTMVAVGDNDAGQCNVDSWTDIVAISAGSWHSVGLKSDGTVVAVGDNDYGQCNVDSWTDIVAVSAGVYHTVGLKSDGTVVAVGAVGQNYSGQCDVDGWTDIVAISAGGFHTVGLKADGTVVAVGSNVLGQCDVGDWKAIKLPGN